MPLRCPCELPCSFCRTSSRSSSTPDNRGQQRVMHKRFPSCSIPKLHVPKPARRRCTSRIILGNSVNLRITTASSSDKVCIRSDTRHFKIKPVDSISKSCKNVSTPLKRQVLPTHGSEIYLDMLSMPQRTCVCGNGRRVTMRGPAPSPPSMCSCPRKLARGYVMCLRFLKFSVHIAVSALAAVESVDVNT